MRYFPAALLLLFSTSVYAEDMPLAGTLQPASPAAPAQALTTAKPGDHKPDDDKPDGEHKHHRRAVRNYVPVYTNIIVTAPVQGMISELSDKVGGDELVIDKTRIVLTNSWHGTCHQNSDCTISAGYMAGNPLDGVILMSQPSSTPTPILMPAPTANGPLRIITADVVAGVLTLEALSGKYELKDEQGKVVQDGVWAKTAETPGRATYSFDINKSKFIQ